MKTVISIQYKMVVLTIVTQKNGETVYFDEPIPQAHFMKLISCSLYNSWHTLKREGSPVLGDEKKNPSVSVSKIPPGHYNLQAVAKVIDCLFEKYQYRQLETVINTPLAVLEIKNLGAKKITLDRDLANLLGINRVPDLTTHVKKTRISNSILHSLQSYRQKPKLFEQQKSDVLAKLDLKGKPYEKVSYVASTHEPSRECSTDSYVKSITVSVRDQDGELFDFNGFNLEFVLEIK